MAAKRSGKSAKGRRPSTASRGRQPGGLYGPSPFVSLGWLIGAATTAVAIGAIGAYLVLCLIFYQNQAMLIFHPSHKIKATPASVHLSYQQVALDPGQNGKYLLTGWWIPAAPNAAYRNDAMLYLHGATGSLSNSLPQIKALHALGINVFAIDYRGFGNSAHIRPTEQTADADALRAWKYLRFNKRFQSNNIVIFGEGAGATFAANLAMQRTVAALVLAQVSPTAHSIFEQDARARLLPLFLLANQHMNPAHDLKRLKIPKLFLEWNPKSATTQSRTRQVYQLAATPKQLASLPGAASYGTGHALEPFLHQVLPQVSAKPARKHP